MKYVVLVALACLALLLGTCAGGPLSSPSGTVDTPQSLVKLDVFSGRENPTWALSDEQSLALGELLAGLEQTSQPAARFEGLGYRGFLVQWVAPESRTQSAFYAGMGLVEVETGGAKVTYLDPGRSVEKWLLESGKAFLDAGLYDSLLDEIQ